MYMGAWKLPFRNAAHELYVPVSVLYDMNMYVNVGVHVFKQTLSTVDQYSRKF